MTQSKWIVWLIILCLSFLGVLAASATSVDVLSALTVNELQ
jgi:hypothetical protein